MAKLDSNVLFICNCKTMTMFKIIEGIVKKVLNRENYNIFKTSINLPNSLVFYETWIKGYKLLPVRSHHVQVIDIE